MIYYFVCEVLVVDCVIHVTREELLVCQGISKYELMCHLVDYSRTVGHGSTELTSHGNKPTYATACPVSADQVEMLV